MKQLPPGQKELFEEYDYSSKWPRFFKKRRFPQKQFMFSLTYEKATLSLVIAVVLLVISFCLGIERGKKIIRAVYPSQQEEPVVQKPAEKLPEPVNNVKLEKKPKLLYTIQVATYVKRASAEHEARRLEKRGFPTYVVESGKYYLLRAGAYETKRGAENAKLKLKAKYKDCFVKKMEVD